MVTCVVKNCRNSTRDRKIGVSKKDGITYHKFPTKVRMREKWTEFVRKSRGDGLWSPVNYSSICSKHFRLEDFYTSAKGRILLFKTAIPEIITTSEANSLLRSESRSQSCVNEVTILDSNSLLIYGSTAQSCDNEEEEALSDISGSNSIFDCPREINLKQQLSNVTASQTDLIKKLSSVKSENDRMRKKIVSLKSLVQTLKIKAKALGRDQVMVLIDLIKKHKVISTKSTNATNNKLKEDAWRAIAAELSAYSGELRRPVQLRLKWENLKKAARKRQALIRQRSLMTGVGKSYIPPDEALDAVAAMLGATRNKYSAPCDEPVEDGEVVFMDSGEMELEEALTTPRTMSPDQTIPSHPSQRVPLSKLRRLGHSIKAEKDEALAKYFKAKTEKTALEQEVLLDEKEKVKEEKEKVILEKEKIRLEIVKLQIEIDSLKNIHNFKTEVL